MRRYSNKQLFVALLVPVALIAAFLVSPFSASDDWLTYYESGQRVRSGDVPLYGTPTSTTGYYYNPPWAAAAVVPFTFLPPKFGWAVLSTLTLILSIAVLQRWTPSPGLVKTLAVLGSPPMVYLLLHGQLDMLVISAVLLPPWLWPLAAMTKPQVTIGLALGVPRRWWLRAAVVSVAVLAVSFIFWGFWPSAAFAQPTPFIEEGHNMWRGLWPFQVPLGVLLLMMGVQRRDERFLIAGSPFLGPYAATSSFMGPWIAAVSYLKSWQVLVVWASWWAAVVYRALAG